MNTNDTAIARRTLLKFAAILRGEDSSPRWGSRVDSAESFFLRSIRVSGIRQVIEDDATWEETRLSPGRRSWMLNRLGAATP